MGNRREVVILGAGLFGSVLARMLSVRGIPYTIIDSGEKYRASRCAAAILKAEWATLPEEKYDRSIEILHTLYGGAIRYHEATNDKNKIVTFETLSPETVLSDDYVQDRVISIEPDTGRVITDSLQVYNGYIYSALGIWTKGLFPHVPMRAGAGSAFIATVDDYIPVARISNWAPYKQAVTFPREDASQWFGDGTAMSPERYTAERRAYSELRARSFGLKVVGERIGVRPYSANEGRVNGYYERVSDRCVIATGGAKVGMVLAPLFAERFINEML